MNKVMVLTLIVSILFILPVILAEEKSYDYDDLDEFLADIPSLNEQLQSGSVMLPGSAGILVKTGNVSVNIEMDDGSSKSFYFTLEDKKITGVGEGTPLESAYEISTNEDTVNTVLESEDKVGAMVSAYDNKEVNLEAHGFMNKIKLFFAKIALKFA
ncbi:hypothetical protein HYT24_02935 [Candidatus Pacearchaeota archaeon]|nr:hypothetical protein [Candidatus Pacearchaeota archaeon]